MKDNLFAMIILKCPLINAAQPYDIHAPATQLHKIQILMQNEPHDTGFPELETLMPEDDVHLIWSWETENNGVQNI